MMSLPWINTIILVYMFAMGACLGSFVNVILVRLPQGESIVRPRSRCPECKNRIAWYDNIPLLSFLILRARCRNCGMQIPFRYFLVESIMAAMIAALWTHLGWHIELLIWIPLSVGLIAIVFLDIDHWWVPDVITFPLFIYVLALSFFREHVSWLNILLGLVPALMIFALRWLFKKMTGREGLGLGDVKLLALLGISMGLFPSISILLLASLQGTIVGLMVLITGGHKGVNQNLKETSSQEASIKSEVEAHKRENTDDSPEWIPPARAIPFGPFLVIGAFEVLFLPTLFADLPSLITSLVLRLYL